MKALCATLACLALVTPAMAALPPDFQRAAEIKAVVDAASDVMAGGGEVIEAVTYRDVDTYEVRYAHCIVRVDIVDIERPQGEPLMVGPRQFEAVAHSPECN